MNFQTDDDLLDAREGDRVRVTYESVYGSRGDEHAFEAEVVRREMFTWAEGAALTVTLTLDADVDESNRRDHYQGEPVNRRVYAIVDRDTGTVYAHVESRNGYRWSRVNRVASDGHVEVLA